MLVQVHRQEHFMWLKIQRWHLAYAEEVGNILHLYKRHRRLLEPYSWGANCQIYQPVEYHPILDIVSPFRTGKHYLQRAVPSFNASNKSPGFNCSPKTSSSHSLVSFARRGVYLSNLKLRRSLSREVTDAMSGVMTTPGAGWMFGWMKLQGGTISARNEKLFQTHNLPEQRWISSAILKFKI